ncbi:GTP-binding protein [Pisolithus orientalis]|uniref:GTP-binding protein n=1 Tax=Pisolithus orientalis TaxID=936130 RepID=UPI002224D4F9|nr:GTP-binding protein [Pisolithus orientalis]KAI5991673.1 GTP-binding protein [Pisolithus orientalis]
MKNIKRFRILIMGRANAGKTTILQRVCNSTAEPEVYDGKGNKIDGVAVQGTLTRGYHNIEHEILFQSNPGFVFHDSCGFEAGSTHQYDEMKKFVVDRATTRKVNERIHAIWFCIPMAECHRTVTAAEEKFFNECDTGHVPLIVVLTKADTLNLDAVQELEDEGLEIEEDKVVEKERKLLEKWCAHIKDMLHKCNFPPRAYVSLQKMHEQDADCTTLMQSTANSLNEEGLQKLLISTQQSSVALCVEYAVQKTLKKCMQQYPQGRFVLDVKFFEHVLMSWFPNCEKVSSFMMWWISAGVVTHFSSCGCHDSM